MIVHIAEASDMDALVEGGSFMLPIYAKIAAKQLWPGPLTMVLRKDPSVPGVTTGGLDTVAIRMPMNETARRLIAAAGVPVAAPSANISGRPSPTTPYDVLEDMDGRIDAVIMGDQCDVGIESTVVDMTGETPVILRPGIITKEWLEAVLGCTVEYDKSLMMKPENEIDVNEMSANASAGPENAEFKPKSPGMKYTHYSPKAKVRLIAGDNETFGRKVMELGVEAKKNGLNPAILEYGNDAKKAAHKLFADLRELDRQGYDIIFIRAIEEKGAGFSVMNRMLKSAGYDIVK
jgi:L-threonylcarbamoyladenylate synthase